MILNNAQMFDSIPALMAAKDETGLLGYALAVNLRRISSELGEYEEQRNQLLQKYGKEESPGNYALSSEALAGFRAELEPLAGIEADVQIIQVAPEVFYGGNLTSSQMFALAYMVKEE